MPPSQYPASIISSPRGRRERINCVKNCWDCGKVWIENVEIRRGMKWITGSDIWATSSGHHPTTASSHYFSMIQFQRSSSEVPDVLLQCKIGNWGELKGWFRCTSEYVHSGVWVMFRYIQMTIYSQLLTMTRNAVSGRCVKLSNWLFRKLPVAKEKQKTKCPNML